MSLFGSPARYNPDVTMLDRWLKGRIMDKAEQKKVSNGMKPGDKLGVEVAGNIYTLEVAESKMGEIIFEFPDDWRKAEDV